MLFLQKYTLQTSLPGLRSYLISTGADLLLCVVTPLVVIYNSSLLKSWWRQDYLTNPWPILDCKDLYFLTSIKNFLDQIYGQTLTSSTTNYYLAPRFIMEVKTGKNRNKMQSSWKIPQKVYWIKNFQNLLFGLLQLLKKVSQRWSFSRYPKAKANSLISSIL